MAETPGGSKAGSSTNPFDEGHVNKRESRADVFVQEVDDFLKFTGAEKPPPNAIFILVMGVTGSGKSTFISKCSGKKVRIGHDLQSCTENLSIVSFTHPDNVHTVFLLDTPGFDDTNKSDAEILSHVAHYLSVSYANRIYISGVLFMHRISDNRTSGTTRRNINMFKKLVGDSAYENVAIATTMWWEGEEESNLKKATQLQDEDFQDVLGGGGKMFRYDGKADRAESQALEILNHLMGKAKEGPVVLNIQHEMVNDGLLLSATAAGKAVAGDMRIARDGIEAQLAETRKDLIGALQQQRESQAQTYREMQIDLVNQSKRIEQDRGSLEKSLLEIYDKEEYRLKQRIEEMEREWQANIGRKKQELTDVTNNLDSLARVMAANAELETERLKQQDKRQEADRQERKIVEERRQKEREQAEEDMQRLRDEYKQLEENIKEKQQATSKVKQSFMDSKRGQMIRDITAGVITTVPAIAAGVFCNVM